MTEKTSPEETETTAPEEETTSSETPSDVNMQDLRVMQDQLLRLRAEFDNYRKRESKERRTSWSRAQADLIKKLLPTLDDLHRVATLNPEETSSKAVIDGVLLVERKLIEMLGREGLAVVGEQGEPFNPHVHEAIGMWPAPKPELAGTVAAVTVRGYQFGQQLLRAAQVQVYEDQSGGSAPADAGAADEPPAT